MSAPDLGSVRACLEGAVPAVMATCALDGTPNVAYLSQVHYVDPDHVALSFQFFNKTRQNILDNPWATLLVLHPVTAQFHRLHLRYLRTETEGKVFERMKAQLAGIASHTGMAAVFKLLGSDIYEVRRIETVPSHALPTPPSQGDFAGRLRSCTERLAACSRLDQLLDQTLDVLTTQLRIQHAMVLMLDEDGQRLFTLASTGYATSGVGSEIALGEGVIGVCARERTPIRIQHMTSAYLYSRAIRSSLHDQTPGLTLATDIAYPGLAEPHSQLAVPMVCAGRLLGVLFVESPHDLAFSFEDEDMLVALAAQLGGSIALLQMAGEGDLAAPETAPPAPAQDNPRLVRYFRSNRSVFLDDSYLVKGVAGAILCKLLREHLLSGRTEFSNRELRLDATLGLPEITDNLEARLLLLQRRLKEQGGPIRLEKCGRGRLRLEVGAPLQLQELA